MIEAPSSQGLIACPYCQSPVPIAIANLLSNQAIACPGCDARFELNKPNSEAALNQLQKWQTSMNEVADEANNKMAETSDSDLPQAYIKRKRRPRRGE